MILKYLSLFLLFIIPFCFGTEKLVNTKSVKILTGYQTIATEFQFPSEQVKSALIYASGNDIALNVPVDRLQFILMGQYSQIVRVSNQPDKVFKASVTGEDEVTLVILFEYVEKECSSNIKDAYEFGKHLYVKENSVVHLPCPLLEDEENKDKTESIKWVYQKSNGQQETVISKDETNGGLTVNASDTERSGLYTCKLKPNDYTYTVKVVKAPYFVEYIKEDEYVGETRTLTCKVERDILPVPKIEWFLDENLINDNKGLDYEDVTRWGNYSCKIKNFFGESSKLTKVKSKGCLIEDRSDDQSYPFLVKSNEVFKKKHGYFVDIGKKIKMFCSPYNNYFKQMPSQNEIEAVCVNEFHFTINGEDYEVTNLRCSTENTPIAKSDDHKCLSDNSSTNSISNSFASANHSTQIYSICYNEDTKKIVYAKTYLDLYYDINNHTENDQKCTITNGSFINLDNSSNMTKIVEEKKLSLDFVIWHKCDRKVEWNDLVKKIRMLKLSLLVWTGTYESYDPYNNSIHRKIPLFIWKVVKNLENQETIAIIYVNQAYPDTRNTSDFNKTNCKGFLAEKDVNNHQLFCTTVQELVSKIGIPIDTFTENPPVQSP